MNFNSNPEKENKEKIASNVTFKNEPKLSQHEAGRQFNERRIELVPKVEEFLSTDEFFEGKKVQVEFSHAGASSLVAIIECGEEKFVLKVPLLVTREGEAHFLKAWEAVGVTVPHLIKDGDFDGNPYILMNYIKAPTVNDAIAAGSMKDDISVSMGETLARMHSAKSEGYGRIVEGKAEYEFFKDWIMGNDMQNRIRYIRKHELLGDEQGSIEDAIETLIAFNDEYPESVCCHFDLGIYNLLATEPLTVIDPDPMLNNGIIDIGRSMMLEIARGKNGEGIKQGYFSDGRHCDEKALRASILLNAYWRFKPWHKVGKVKSMDKVRQYLSRTK